MKNLYVCQPTSRLVRIQLPQEQKCNCGAASVACCSSRVEGPGRACNNLIIIFPFPRIQPHHRHSILRNTLPSFSLLSVCSSSQLQNEPSRVGCIDLAAGEAGIEVIQSLHQQCVLRGPTHTSQVPNLYF